MTTETNDITFERLESDYHIGKIRSVTVDHVRGRLIIVSDKQEEAKPEGATTPLGKSFTTQYDEDHT